MGVAAQARTEITAGRTDGVWEEKVSEIKKN